MVSSPGVDRLDLIGGEAISEGREVSTVPSTTISLRSGNYDGTEAKDPGYITYIMAACCAFMAAVCCAFMSAIYIEMSGCLRPSLTI